MTIRKISILVGIIIFAGSILLFNILSAGPEDEQQAFGNGPASVGVAVLEANPSNIISEIPFTGRVIPDEEVLLFTEVTGTLNAQSKEFKAGTWFQKGEVILSIDDREQRQAVFTQKSQFKSLLTQTLADINIDYPDEYEAWSSYLNSFDVENELAMLPETENQTFQLFLTGRNVYSNYYSIKQSEVRLSKYTIRAPYDGVLTEALILPGTLVRVNQQLGRFTKINSYEIEASINVTDRFFVNRGDEVVLALSDETDTEIQATVSRINSIVDASTQTLLVYLSTSDRRVLSGQYVSGSISGRSFESAQKIASKSLVRDDIVFVIKDSVATIQQVEVLKSSGDSVIIGGLAVGDLIIDEFRDASFEGTKVIPVKN